MAQKRATPEELAALKVKLDTSEMDFDNAKLAYFHRTSYKDEEITYEVLKRYAEAYIAHNHAYQKAAFGKVRVKLNVARLLRE
jgi:hypothetical protein